MIDQLTLQRINLLHPKVREEVKEIYINQICPALKSTVFCRFAYTQRTFAEQDILYAQGRTRLYDSNGNRLGRVTNASGGQSFHNYSLALDIVLIDGNQASWNTVKDYDEDGKSDWNEVADIFLANDWEWGALWKFKDPPHFQKVFGYDWRDLLNLYEARDFIPGTNYVNI